MSKRQPAKEPKSTTISNNFDGKLSIVIPCYNESKRVGNLLQTLKDFDRKWAKELEIILVDDGSKDDTAKKIQDTFSDSFSGNSTFELIQLPKNQGKGAALKAGVEKSTGDFVLTLDADMATDPNELFQWLKMLPGRTFDPEAILIGSREHEKSQIKGQVMRRFAGLIFNFIIQLFTSLNITDTQCGFKLYPAGIAKRLFSGLRTNGWAHDVELLYQAKFEGVDIRPMPVKWTHQEDSKISLVADSLKMLVQTILISISLNFRWFIVQPIRDLKNRSFNGGDPSYYRLLFVIVTVSLFFLMPWLSFDFGITGDEEVQKIYGEKILAYFETDGEDKSALDYKNLYYYGGLFDYCAAWLNKYVGGFDEYDLRHMLNAFVGFLMIFFTGLLAREVSSSWRVAFFALIFMALSPRIFGHSMNNPKDIPFAAAYVFTLLYLIRFLKNLPNPGSKTILMLIIGIAAAINVRVGGILLIAYFGLFTGLTYLLQPKLRAKLSDFKHVGKIAGIGLIVAVLAFFGGMLFWPYALQAPLSNPFKSLSEMSNFSTSIRMLFEGAHLWSDELPWYYTLKWIGISAPVFILLGLVFFAVYYILKFKKIDYLPLLFVLFTAVFPVAYAVYKGSSLYDGMRHFLFIYPILATLAAWGWNELIVTKNMKWIGSGLLVVLLTLPTFWMVKNHPYQYTYFNEIFGGTSKAYGKYETDYWMTSIKGMCEWLIENDARIEKGEPVVVHTNCYEPARHYLTRKYPNAKIAYVRYDERAESKGDYFMFISRFVNYEQMNNGAWPPAEVIHTESAGGAVLGAISKRNIELYDYYGSEAEKAKDYAKAVELFTKEAEQNPKNETAWLGLANNYMQLGNFPKAKEAIDEYQKISATHINGLMALSLYYLNTGDTENAKATLEKMTRLNYKYNASYFYLAPIYARENQPLKAIAAIEKYDEVGGNFPQAYDTGIQLAKQLNLRVKELYFQAKKAYFQQNGTEAYNFLKQALAVDPNYEPAIKLNEAFDEIIAKQNEKK